MVNNKSLMDFNIKNIDIKHIKRQSVAEQENSTDRSGEGLAFSYNQLKKVV